MGAYAEYILLKKEKNIYIICHSFTSSPFRASPPEASAVGFTRSLRNNRLEQLSISYRNISKEWSQMVCSKCTQQIVHNQERILTLLLKK